MDGLPSSEVARRFGYSAGAFRVLCHDFRRHALPEFFAAPRPGRREQPKKSRAHDQIVALRKRNYSVYEISQALKEQGMALSATAVREVLAAGGFAPLPRRLDEERPVRIGPNAQAVANVGEFVLSPRGFTTRTDGLFLFIPDLVRLDSDAWAQAAKLPGSRMVPSAHTLRASLALKLWAIERESHVMALVADEGLALFCGLNAMPKKSFLSEYSSRITPQKVERLLALWHAQVTGDVFTGGSLNLDFHSVPYFGEHPHVESHYLAKRSRRQPSILVFLAQDADAQVFCCANTDIRKGEEADEIFRFIDFWKRQHGKAAATPRVRLQAYHLCGARSARCRRHHLHHPAPALAQAARRSRRPASIGLAHRRARHTPSQISQSTLLRTEGATAAARLPSVLHHRPRPR
jgi:transposase